MKNPLLWSGFFFALKYWVRHQPLKMWRYEEMKYFKKLVGEKCYLSPVSVEDAEKYTEWLNDMEVLVNLTMISQVVTLEGEREYLNGIAKDTHNCTFGIIDLKTDKLIGNCGLHNINKVNSHAMFGIFIGDKAFWNKGYGYEATRLILDFGFNILNLNNIFLGVYEFNKRAIKCYEKCGFKKIGNHRQCKIISGKKYDVVLMDMLAEEFESPYVKKYFNKKENAN